MFSHGNHHYLVYADRLSGWTTINVWAKDPTAKEVAKAVAKNFVDLGVPVRFRSDGGPQFSGGEFTKFLDRWGVDAVLSTPHYPQSNGHAEAAIKAMKALTIKSVPNGRLDDESFQQALLEWRNTPRSDGLSPAQRIFGHPLRSLVPAHHRSYAKEWQNSMEECDRFNAEQKTSATDRYNERARPLEPLNIGTPVRIQDPNSKLWDRSGIIISKGRHRDYRVKQPSGRILWRNRRFLRENVAPPDTSLAPPVAAPEGTEDEEQRQQGKRKKKSVKFANQLEKPR